ncbi:hypothetical protein [Kibdelosporangium philippinense]|uniref:hypothetical protein n=1 Tax=Kibdelosporangium philippinense TaxID=211113 RepID=UPI003610B543
MKVTLTALNATNLPLAPAYRPHGAVARQRDRGHDRLPHWVTQETYRSPTRTPVQQRPISKPDSWHWRSTPLTRPSRTVATATFRTTSPAPQGNVIARTGRHHRDMSSSTFSRRAALLGSAGVLGAPLVSGQEADASVAPQAMGPDWQQLAPRPADLYRFVLRRAAQSVLCSPVHAASAQRRSVGLD